MKSVPSSPRHAALALVILLALSSCKGPSAYKPTVAKFRDSSSVVIEGTKSYLVALNKTERDRYIQRQSAEAKQIRLDEIEEVQAFSPEAIGARLRALDRLAEYTDLLYQLTVSDAPETAKARAADLGTALTGLSDEVTKLSGAKNDGFKAAVGKAIPIIGDVLKAIVAKRIEDALKDAIVAGETPVTTLIQAIKTDAEVAYQLKRNSFSAQRVASVNDYNREFEKGAQADRAKLKAYADQISATENRWELFQTARPVDGLDAMQKAAAAMVKFAKIPKPNVSDFASFVETMEAFASTAKRVGEAVNQLNIN